MKLTITEALAELKTLSKRILKKRQFILDHLLRFEAVRDPLEKDGGTPEAVRREGQALADLEARVVEIRTRIQQANHRITVIVAGQSRTLAEWLTWRKEVAPGRQQFVEALRQGVIKSRASWQRKANENPDDAGLALGISVHVDEVALAQEAEQLEVILGGLDGQLSLKNATEFVELND